MQCRDLLDSVSEIIFTTDLQGALLFVNRAGINLFRAPGQENKNRSYWEVVAAESQEKARHLFKLTKDQTEAGPIILECLSFDNRSIQLEVRTRLLQRQGRPIGIQGVARDVTCDMESKERRTDLAFERGLLRALLDNTPDRIYFKDRQSRFLRVNKEMAKRFSVTEQEAVGKSDFDFFTREHAQPAYDDEQQIIRSGEPVIGRIEKETFSIGKTNWVLTCKMPLLDEAGNIVGTFGISKDINDIKEAEANLEKVHKQLVDASRQAGMAEVATSVLHNVGNVLNSVNISASMIEDQIKTSKIANIGRVSNLMFQHSQDIGDFMSHDPKGLQLPGYLSQLSEHLNREQASILKEIHDLKANVEHIKEIVAMQQNYAKVGGVTERIKAVELAEDSLRINAGALVRHDVKLIKDYLDPQVEVEVEKHKVLQILVNLIRNAKYACDEMPGKEKTLTVRIAKDPANQRVRIQVADTGVGIPPENITRIFNHGFTTRKQGHGFGLHSSALAAKELGGSLTAFSEGTGKGATFTLDLPMPKL